MPRINQLHPHKKHLHHSDVGQGIRRITELIGIMENYENY